ncbi:MAG TPA: hypothetical protein VF544_21185 [Pyrinomonadaceae bacterium]|jgi:hypothetical protein
MLEVVSQHVALTGQVIEDVTYEELGPQQYRVSIRGVNKTAHYKRGGFFAFSDLAPGDYTLLITGERFQTEQYALTLPLNPTFLRQPGDNDAVVKVKTINAGNNHVSFDPVILPKEIRAGALVIGQQFSATLAATLSAGEVTSARLSTVDALAQGDFLRFVRDSSIRLRFDPYYLLPAGFTRIVGQVTLGGAPEIALAGAEVRLSRVNDTPVATLQLGDAEFATVRLDGADMVLGAVKDTRTLTNARGDYNLYFSDRINFQSVTLEVTLAAYQAALGTRPVSTGRRNRIDVALARA